MNKVIQNEEGFTLIEVIAVLIIIGILAAVAVPKYFDVSEEAKNKAYESALSNGMSLCSLAYGKAALIADGSPDIDQVFNALSSPATGLGSFIVDPDGTNSTAGVDLTIQGDFEYTFTKIAAGITINVSPKNWAVPGSLPSETWLLP